MGKIETQKLGVVLEKLRKLAFTCPTCHTELFGADAKTTDLDEAHVWVYITCPGCQYDWALWKLLSMGNPRRIPTLEDELAKFK